MIGAICLLAAGTVIARAGELPAIAGWHEDVAITITAAARNPHSDTDHAAGTALPAVTDSPPQPAQVILLSAKLDTGADHSSLHAEAIEPMLRDGAPWVRFRIFDSTGNRHQLERPLLRQATIRRAGTHADSRPVIELWLCVAGRSGPAEVTLADRHAMSRPFLVGRSFLAGRLLVDANQSNLGKGACGDSSNSNGQAK